MIKKQVGEFLALTLTLFSCTPEINDGVYMEQNDKGKYSVYFEERISSGGRSAWYDKIRVLDVESLIISHYRGTMVFGRKNIKQKKLWYYIDASPEQALSEGFHDSLLRNDEIVTMGFEYLDSVKTAEQVWQSVK